MSEDKHCTTTATDAAVPFYAGLDDGIPFDDAPDGDSDGEAVDLDELLDGNPDAEDDDESMALEAIEQDETYEEMVALAAHAEAERDAMRNALVKVHNLAVNAHTPDNEVRRAVLEIVDAVLEVQEP